MRNNVFEDCDLTLSYANSYRAYILFPCSECDFIDLYWKHYFIRFIIKLVMIFSITIKILCQPASQKYKYYGSYKKIRPFQCSECDFNYKAKIVAKRFFIPIKCQITFISPASG